MCIMLSIRFNFPESISFRSERKVFSHFNRCINRMIVQLTIQLKQQLADRSFSPRLVLIVGTFTAVMTNEIVCSGDGPVFMSSAYTVVLRAPHVMLLLIRNLNELCFEYISSGNFVSRALSEVQLRLAVFQRSSNIPVNL